MGYEANISQPPFADRPRGLFDSQRKDALNIEKKLLMKNPAFGPPLQACRDDKSVGVSPRSSSLTSLQKAGAIREPDDFNELKMQSFLNESALKKK
jgi:hypothetical protein